MMTRLGFEEGCESGRTGKLALLRGEWYRPLRANPKIQFSLDLRFFEAREDRGHAETRMDIGDSAPWCKIARKIRDGHSREPLRSNFAKTD